MSNWTALSHLQLWVAPLIKKVEELKELNQPHHTQAALTKLDEIHNIVEEMKQSLTR
jgi:hypothetical protein